MSARASRSRRLLPRRSGGASRSAAISRLRVLREERGRIRDRRKIRRENDDAPILGGHEEPVGREIPVEDARLVERPSRARRLAKEPSEREDTLFGGREGKLLEAVVPSTSSAAK